MVGDLDELLDVQRLRDLRGRSSSASTSPTGARVQCRERPDARLRRRANGARPLRAARPERASCRGGGALSRPGRARDQAASAGAALPPRRPAARARVRARFRARCADPDPRRPRSAADRGLAGATPRPPLPSTLIIAHAGIVDLAGIARHFCGREGVFFDTSVWSALDLLDLYRLVSPEQILYASDYPYGRQPNSLLMAMRTARAIRARRRAAARDAARDGGTRSPTVSSRSLPRRPPRLDEVAQPITFARIHQYLSMAGDLLWTRHPRTRSACSGSRSTPATSARTGIKEATEQIRQLLARDPRLWTLVGRVRRRGVPGADTAAPSGCSTSPTSSRSRPPPSR